MSNNTTTDNVPKGSADGGRRTTVGILLFIGSSGFPAAGKAGFFGGDWGLTLQQQMALSAGVGALAGWLMAWHWAGLLGGAMAGPGGYFAIVWWADGRQQIFKLELVLAQMVGSLPGLLVTLGLMRLTATPPPEEPIPDEYRRPPKPNQAGTEN